MMEKTLLLALLLPLTAHSALLHSQDTYASDFDAHVEKYDLKNTVTDFDYDSRLAIFSTNSDIIEAHNSEEASYTLGHNEFSHLSFDEFENMYLSELMPRKESSRFVNAFENSEPAEEIDWAETEAVTEVKNQGSCGSCWSFSTTGSLEGAYYLTYGEQMVFSEQQLVSCDTEVNMGCNGGLMDNAFQYISENGLCTEDSYPYTSAMGVRGQCGDVDCKPVGETKGITFTDVAQSDEALESALTQQPVSVAVDADAHWQLYKGGVLTQVDGTQLDHGVLAVGYGSEGKKWRKNQQQRYWKIKNSWGNSWGEGGYIRIAKGDGSPSAGITLSASYPNINKKKEVVTDTM